MNTEITNTEITNENKPCDQCDWRMGEHPSPPALRMHKIRKHRGKGWNTSGNFKRTPRNGPSPSQIPENRRRKYREQVARYHAMGLNAHGEPFKNSAVSMGMRKSLTRRKHYVYPVPQEQTNETPTVAAMNFCPHCGENLNKWSKA